ncbi:ABC-F family ATP-binding cassette domain-containing protein [Candidatus Poribacteria bacterium]|nr:ABC-F family ATP-binding cassette domain-containing protein [Candidatus Poribacteria bacterium]
MSLVRLDQVTKSYDPYLILDEVSLSIEHGDRIGLIGKNGTGKTTLIEIVAGIIEDFKGNIGYAKRLQIGYLSQEPNLEADCSLRQEMFKVFQKRRDLEDEMLLLSEEMVEDPNLLDRYARLQEQHERMGGYDYEYQTNRTLGGLGFRDSDFNLKTGVLSGGQKSRAALAKLLLEDPDLLLLDEPTNHLDIKAIEWLENFLNTEYQGAVIIVSHDRYFLDRVARKIIELRNHKLTEYPGNYTKYLEIRQTEKIAQEREYKKQKRYIAHEEDFIRRNMAGQRTREAQGRQKLLDRLERVEKPETDEKTIKLRFTPDVRGGNDILQCQGLGKRYGDKQIFEDMNMEIYRQDVVGVIGPNGVGKTTLFRMMLGNELPTSGKLKVGHNLHFGYYDQELVGLNQDNTIIDEIWALRPTQKQGEIRSFLGRFLFSDDEVFKWIGDLSGGEQSRVMLAKLLLENANVLLLDEPTNHLDIPSREVLEEALAAYPATIFMISHDRYFLNSLVNKLLIFENGTANLFFGTYAEYEAHVREQKRQAMQAKEEAEKAKKVERQEKQRRERLRVASTSKKSKKKRRVKAQRVADV